MSFNQIKFLVADAFHVLLLSSHGKGIYIKFNQDIQKDHLKMCVFCVWYIAMIINNHDYVSDLQTDDMTHTGNKGLCFCMFSLFNDYLS